ncbi:MAG: biotin synthase, partial [Pseudomonadota bacterium]
MDNLKDLGTGSAATESAAQECDDAGQHDGSCGKASGLRHDWTADEILEILQTPLIELVHRAQTVHKQYHPENTVQLASLLSIKTGACPEDCKYCPQSAHYTKETGLQREKLMQTNAVLEAAQVAKDAGATRFCMGAAWREVREGADFDQVVDMVQGVTDMGMEA